MAPIVELEVIPEFFHYSPSPYVLREPLSLFRETSTKNVLDLDRSMDGETIYHFPVILVDRLPWRHSTNYLISRALDFTPVKSKTLIGIARDLRDFKVWIIHSGTDYLSCKKVPQSPIRRYKRYLNTSEYSVNVIRRKLSRVVSFYRWLQDEEKIVFEQPLWRDQESKVLTTNREGSRIFVNVRSTDVQKVRGSGQYRGLGYDGFIQDGGLLRPHSIREQKIIFSCLREIGNTEMTLGFLIAFTTGARLQTVFTLRRCQFERTIEEGQSEIIVYVGPWPKTRAESELSEPIAFARLTNTKNSKRLKLYFPTWVYQKVKVYLQSDRYRRRSAQSEHCKHDRRQQYIFLTSRARPFYLSNDDLLARKYREPPVGASVQGFISSQLKPLLKKRGFDGHFKFHNLRATYGMNIVRSKTSATEFSTNLNVTELFALVKTRLGHSDIKTTQQYLSFDLKQEIANSVQNSYELFLDGLYKDLKEDWVNA